MNYLVRDRDVIFNLAGQVSHIDSMRDPYTDLEINCRSQLTLLEACRHHNPASRWCSPARARSTAGPTRCRSTEHHLVRPTDVNGINKAAGEYYHLVYNNVFGVRACSLRLTNVYGPRQLIRHNRQGFIGWFIRLAIEDATIQIYGDGSQLRDFVYVDDAADAFLRAGASDACNGEVFNVGGDEPISASRSDDAAGRDRRHRAASSTSSGRRRRRRSTSALLRRLDRSSSATTGWTPTVAAARRAARARSRSTAQHFDRYVDAAGARRGARVTRAAHSVHVAGAARGRRRRPRRDRPRHRQRLVRPRSRSRGVRSASSPPRAARRTRSASAPAPTRSR